MNDHLTRIHILTKAVIVSGVLNVVFVGLLIYSMIREKPPVPYYELKPADKKELQIPQAMDHSNAHIIRQLRMMPFEQLVAKLSDTALVENGYTMRDLALACLAHIHQFDIHRALLGMAQPEQERTLVYGKMKDGSPAVITIFPGLTDQQYEAIIHYANIEKWPLTSKGLFLRIRSHHYNKETPEASLIDAFLLTPEFLTVEMLFNRSETPVEKGELLKVICEGDWLTLESFSTQQRSAQDLTPARRQWFLMTYIDQGSRAAAYMILKTDPAFATLKFDDRHVMTMLRLLSEKTPEAEQFALTQLTSPRSNAVWALAAKRLYLYSGETPPSHYQHHTALERFVKKKTVPIKAKSPVAVMVNTSKSKTYVVQEGDSLWKIARKYKVDLDKLRKTNRLQSDFLKPGTVLKIP